MGRAGCVMVVNESVRVVKMLWIEKDWFVERVNQETRLPLCYTRVMRGFKLNPYFSLKRFSPKPV